MSRLIAMLAVVLGLAFLAVPSHGALAYDPYNGVDCATVKNAKSAVCTDKNNGSTDPLTGDNGLLINIANIVAFVAGVAAVIIIIVGGIRFITSSGDSNGVSKAKNSVAGAIIGLAIIVLARTLIVYVIKNL